MTIYSLKHDCAVPAVSLPEDVLRAVRNWRCPTCGQGWVIICAGRSYAEARRVPLLRPNLRKLRWTLRMVKQMRSRS